MTPTTLNLSDLLEAPPIPQAALMQADIKSATNFTANLTALAKVQPDLINHLRDIEINYEWTFARDGFLTARSPDGTWWRGCSVPLLAGRQAMKKLQLTGPLGCFL